MIKLIEVKPRLKEYTVPYSGDYSLAGYYGSDGLCTHKLALLWLRMMRRCYDQTGRGYAKYGGRGVTVYHTWHVLDQFIRDVPLLPGYGGLGYQLDKDYYSSNQYSPDTCVWLPAEMNAAYTSRVMAVKVTPPDGNPRLFLSQTSAAEYLCISHKRLSAWLLGTRSPMGSIYFGWLFEYAETEYPLRHILESE